MFWSTPPPGLRIVKKTYSSRLLIDVLLSTVDDTCKYERNTVTAVKFGTFYSMGYRSRNSGYHSCKFMMQKSWMNHSTTDWRHSFFVQIVPSITRPARYVRSTENGLRLPMFTRYQRQLQHWRECGRCCPFSCAGHIILKVLVSASRITVCFLRW